MPDLNSSDGGFAPKIPPHDTDAEQAVIGSMFFGDEPISIANERLVPEDFYRAENRMVFETMVELFVEDRKADLVTVKARLDEKKLTEAIGGQEYLVSLANFVSTEVNIDHYIDIVEKKSILRKLIGLSSEISKESYESSKEVEEILELAEKGIFDISQDRKSQDFTPIKDILGETIDVIEELYKSGDKISGLETGFVDFDQMTAGLQPSDLILIAARPSMGKTALALNIAQHVGIRDKKNTAIFSLEMSKTQLVNRILCAEAMIDTLVRLANA